MKRKEVIGVQQAYDENMFKPMPIGEFAKTLSDEEIIEEISLHEARKQFFKYTINGATTAFYESMIDEWQRRHGKKHIPRIAYKKEHIYKYFSMDIGF